MKYLLILCLLIACEPTPQPTAKTVPIGDGIEAAGTRLIDTIRAGPSEQETFDAVSSWVAAHPNHTIECMTPIDYHGGGDSGLSLKTLLVVAVKREDTP